MQIACSTASFPQESLHSALRRIAWAGFGAVELDLQDGEAPDASDLLLRLRNEGLEVASIHAGTAPAATSGDDFETWGRIGRTAALARELDCGHVVLTAPALGNRAGVREGLILLDKALGDLPVEVCLVNRCGTLLSDPDQVQELWRLALPARVRFALDPAQAELAGWDPLDLGRLPRAPSDAYWNDLREGRVIPAGEGQLPLFALAESLLAIEPPLRSVVVSLENADPWRVEPLAREIYRQTLIQFENPDSP